MFELPESMLVRTELFAAWGVILLLAGIMMLDSLRGFARELFGSRGTAALQPVKAQKQKQSRVPWAWPALMLVIPLAQLFEYIMKHVTPQ